MGVFNGQSVSAEVTNPAFIDANADDQTLAKLGLNDQDVSLVSGSAITNSQREINSVASFIGKALNTIKNFLPTWSNNEGFTANQTLLARGDSISAKFKTSGGHAHNPAVPGDGAAVDASYIANVSLRALIQQGVNVIGVTGSSSNISGQFALKNPSSNATTKGVVVNTPQNAVVIRQASGANQGDSYLDGAGNIIYGRITFSASVWTLSYYSLVGAVENVYSFVSSSDVSFYYQEIFNPLFEGPTYNPALYLPSENTTADVVDASTTQRGVVTTGTQSFAGAKTFTGNLKGTAQILGDSETDATATGSNATLTSPQKLVRLLTNASLVSISLITPVTESQTLVLVNQTGNSILINDLNTTAGHIRTGTGANITFRNNMALVLVYDKVNSRWVVVGANVVVSPQTYGSTPNSSGLTFDPVTGSFTLQPSSSVFSGGNSIVDQDYKGEKRFTEGLAFQIGIDATTVGAGQTVDGGSIGLLKVTNAGLSSIALILRKNSTSHLLVLVNGTGATITIQNLTGTETATAKQIRTGTGADITLASNSSLFLIHDENSGKWQVVGGTGSGTGSGSTSGNLITNGNAENATTSIFIPYADASASRPVDGTGGSPTVTTSVTSVTPLMGTKSFLLTKPASNVQGQGWAVPLTVDPGIRAKVLNISVEYIVNTGTFVSGTTTTDSDVIMYLYDVTNSLLIEPSSIKLLSSSSTISDRFQSTFQTTATGSSYRLIAHVATTSTAAYELKVDEVTITPATYSFGTPITDWVAFTPVVVGFGTVTLNVGYYRTSGDSYEVFGRFVAGTTTATTARLGLPNSASFDTLKVNVSQASTLGIITKAGAATSFPATAVGPWVVTNDNTSPNFLGIAATTDVAANHYPLASGSGLGSSGQSFSYEYKVPILGKSSSVQTSDQTDTRVIAANGGGNPNNTITGSSSKVTWATTPIGFDRAGGWDPTNNYYVVRAAGAYAVKFSTEVTQTTIFGSVLYVAIFHRNSAGSLIVSSAGFDRAFGAGSTSQHTVASHEFDCKTGDTIEFQILATGTTPVYSNSLSGTQFDIERSAGPNQIAATETVSAISQSVVTQSIPTGTATTVIFGSVVKDTHGSFNPTTGIFTVLIAGEYQVNSTCGFVANATGVRRAQARQTGSQSNTRKGNLMVATSADTNTFAVNTKFQCLVGDQLFVQVTQSSGGNLNLTSDATENFINIIRLGNY